MPKIRALVAAFGLRSTAKNQLMAKVLRPWGGLWTLLFVYKLIRIVRHRQQRVIVRKIINEGDVLVISNSVSREQ